MKIGAAAAAAAASSPPTATGEQTEERPSTLVSFWSEPSPSKVADHAETSEEDEGPITGPQFIQPTNIDKIVHNQFTTAIKKKGSLDNFTESQLARCMFLVSVFFHY